MGLSKFGCKGVLLVGTGWGIDSKVTVNALRLHTLMEGQERLPES